MAFENEKKTLSFVVACRLKGCLDIIFRDNLKETLAPIAKEFTINSNMLDPIHGIFQGRQPGDVFLATAHSLLRYKFKM